MSWEPLADSNPVPGDPGAVKALAADMAAMADALTDQAANLEAFMDGTSDWEGGAREAFVRMAEKVPPKLRDAGRRYHKASSALAAYAPKLEDAQTKRDTLLGEARTAQNSIDQLGPLSHQQAADESAARNDPTLPPRNGPDYTSGLHDAQQRLKNARHDVERLQSELKVDARIAADEIREAAKIMTDDGRFKAIRKAWHSSKKFARWVTNTKVFKIVSTVVKVVAALLAIAALIAALLVPGANIAAALALAALISGGAALLVSATEAHGGKGSWKMVAVDAVLTFAGLRAFKAAGSAGKLSRVFSSASKALKGRGTVLKDVAKTATKFRGLKAARMRGHLGNIQHIKSLNIKVTAPNVKKIIALGTAKGVKSADSYMRLSRAASSAAKAFQGFDKTLKTFDRFEGLQKGLKVFDKFDGVDFARVDAILKRIPVIHLEEIHLSDIPAIKNAVESAHDALAGG